MRAQLAVLLCCSLLAACATTGMEGPASAFRLTAPGLEDNAMLAQKYAGNLKSNPNCVGENVSPALQWSNAPEKTRSFVLLMDDQAGRAGLGVSHMVVYGIAANVTSFAEGELSAGSSRFVTGKNLPGTPGYFGPCPPRGNAPQHYVFTLIATDVDPAAIPAGLTKEELLKALQGRALRAASVVLRFAH